MRGNDFNAKVRALVVDALNLGVGIRGKGIDRDDYGQAEEADVFDVLLEIFDAPFNRSDIGFGNAFERGSAVKFEWRALWLPTLRGRALGRSGGT